FLLFRLAALDPALLVRLGNAAQREGAFGHVFGDRRARADVGAVADGDRRHELGVAADEDLLSDPRSVLRLAVVVAGDDARADVGPFADVGVAEVGQVLRLRPLADDRVLRLDEVADPGVLLDLGAGRQA